MYVTKAIIEKTVLIGMRLHTLLLMLQLQKHQGYKVGQVQVRHNILFCTQSFSKQRTRVLRICSYICSTSHFPSGSVFTFRLCSVRIILEEAHCL